MPKRPKIRIPKYRRHPNGQAFVQIKGERFYLGKFDTDGSRLNYQRIIAQFLTGEPVSKSAPASEESFELTVVELISKYWQHCQSYYRKNGSPTSEIEIIKPVLRRFKNDFGRMSASEIGPLKLKAFRQKYIDQGLARTTINKYTGRVIAMFKWAVEQELLPPDRHQSLAAVSQLRKDRSDAREPKKIYPVNDSTVDATLQFLSPVVAAMVRLQRLSGMRPQEVCILRPMDLDRKADVWRYVPESHKTEHHNKSRVVFLGPRCQAVLLPFLLRDEESYCFSPAEARNSTVHLKRGPGNRYSTASYRRAVHRACDRAEMERWSPNRLRHAAATEIRREFGVESAKITLGHSNVMTSEIYAQRDETLAEKVALKLG